MAQCAFIRRKARLLFHVVPQSGRARDFRQRKTEFILDKGWTLWSTLQTSNAVSPRSLLRFCRLSYCGVPICVGFEEGCKCLNRLTPEFSLRRRFWLGYCCCSLPLSLASLTNPQPSPKLRSPIRNQIKINTSNLRNMNARRT